MMTNMLWMPEVDQECSETSHWMWHPNLLHLCAAPNEQGLLLGAVAILGVGCWWVRSIEPLWFLVQGRGRGCPGFAVLPPG